MGAIGRFFRNANRTVELASPKHAWQKQMWKDAIKAAIEEGYMDPAKVQGLDGTSKKMVISGLTEKEAKFLKDTIDKSTLQVTSQEGKIGRGLIGTVISLCQDTSKHKLTIDAKDPHAVAFLNSLQEQLVSGKLGANSFSIKVNDKTGEVEVEMKATGDKARTRVAEKLSTLAAEAHYDVHQTPT